MNPSAAPSGTFQWPVMAHIGRTAHLLYILYIKVPGGSVVAVGHRCQKISSLGPNEVGEPARSPYYAPSWPTLAVLSISYIFYIEMYRFGAPRPPPTVRDIAIRSPPPRQPTCCQPCRPIAAGMRPSLAPGPLQGPIEPRPDLGEMPLLPFSKWQCGAARSPPP